MSLVAGGEIRRALDARALKQALLEALEVGAGEARARSAALPAEDKAALVREK